MDAAAAAVTEAARWAPTLSADEPMHDVAPWRLFMATGWLTTAVNEALPDGAPIQEAAA